MKKTLLSTILGLSLLTQSALAAPAKTITDSLVNNLSCSNLSTSSILLKIRPTAFSAANHMPIKNWSFNSGAIGLAACWGMSSTQRKLFYLLRLSEKDAPALDLRRALDIVRGTTVGYALINPQSTNDDTQRLDETKLTEYSVIRLNEKNITEEWGRNTGLSFLDKMLKGATYKNGNRDLFRGLRTEVERSQELHFFRPSNIDMGAGSGPRSADENRKSLARMTFNMSSNRLTLINLRLAMTTQHIVIPKTFMKDDKGNVWIRAYDSNQPEKDQLIYFDNNSGHFFSPQIMGKFIGDYSGVDYTHPLGVYIVDEEERGYIEKTLLKYYQAACK